MSEAAKTTDVLEAEPEAAEETFIEIDPAFNQSDGAEQVEEAASAEQQTDAPPQEPAAEQPAAPSLEEVLVKRKLEHLDRIEHFRRKVMEKKLLLMEAKEIAKERRKQLDSAMEDLLDEIGDKPSAQLELPGVGGGNAQPVSVEQETPKPAVDPEAWRAVTLVDAGIDPKIAAKLEEIDVDTVGKYSDWCNKGGRLIDVKGIGKAKVDKFEDQLEAFWKRWEAEEVAAEAAAESKRWKEGRVPARVKYEGQEFDVVDFVFGEGDAPGKLLIGDDDHEEFWVDGDGEKLEIIEWRDPPEEQDDNSPNEDILPMEDARPVDDDPQLSVVSDDDEEDDDLGDI